MGDQYMRFVQRVKDASDIVSVATEAGCKLARRGGDQLVCKPPWRPSEKDPSCRIYISQNSYADYGGDQTAGDPIDFVQRWRGCTFREAIDFLAERSGIDWQDGRSSGGGLSEETNREIEMLVERRRVHRIGTDCAVYYHECMTDEVAEWLLESYGFDRDVIDKFQIGYADGTLMGAMRDRGYTTEHLLETGLFMRSQRGTIFEQHEFRVTFPYQRDGLCPYMISRRVPGITPDSDFQKAKYKKTLVRREGREYISKHVRNDIFYGEDSVRGKVKQLVITEGVTDAITAIVAGLKVISPVTMRFKRRDIERAIKLAENADEIIIVNDNEEPREDPSTGRIIQPGLDGAVDMAREFHRAGRGVRIGILPRPEGVEKVDVNSLVKQLGKGPLLDTVHNALDFPMALIDRLPEKVQPALLDETLSPVYEVIARCPSRVTRESYAGVLAKKYGISVSAIQESIQEFTKALAKLPAPPATPSGLKGFMEGAPESFGGGGSGAGGGGDGSGGGGGGDDDDPPYGSGGSRRPPTNSDVEKLSPEGRELLQLFKGAIHEDPRGFYVEYGKNKKGEKVVTAVSNFIMRSKKVVISDGGDGRYLLCDIYSTSGNIPNVPIALRHFQTARSFRAFLSEQVHSNLAFSGSDANLEALKHRLGHSELREVKGVSSVGYHRAHDGKGYFVGPDLVMDERGIVEDPPVVFVSGNSEGYRLARMVDLRGAFATPESVRGLAQRVLPRLFEVHEPGVVVPMMGWFAAAAVSPQIRRSLAVFPNLYCWGTAGSGKTTLNRLVFLPIFAGVAGELFIAADTPFARTCRLASSASVPIIHDEKRHLKATNEQHYNRKYRENYDGTPEQKGRQDLRVVTYGNSAPLATIAESRSDDVAAMERAICVSPRKPALTEDRRDAMQELLREELVLLGGHFQRWCLGVDVEDYLTQARRKVLGSLVPRLGQTLPPRVVNNMVIMVAGVLIAKAWSESLGVSMDNFPPLEAGFDQAVWNLSDRDDGGPTKDKVDRFFEDLSVLARLGIVQLGVHFGRLDSTAKPPGGLWIDLRACHSEHAKEQRRKGADDYTEGVGALRRVLAERDGVKGDYVVALSREVRLPGIGKKRRRVIIDESLIPEGLAIEFPGDEGGGSFGGRGGAQEGSLRLVRGPRDER